MKILFLHDKFTKDGGAEKCIIYERELFEKKGHETFLFAAAENEIPEIKNSKLLIIRKKSLFGSYLRSIKIYRELKKYIKKINPGLIYIHNNYEYPFSFLRACKGFKTIQRVHDFGIVCPSRWCAYKDNLKICDGKMGIKCLKRKCISPILFLSYFIKLKYIKKNKTVKLYLPPSKILAEYMKNNGFKNVKAKKYPFFINEGKEKIKREKNNFLYVGGLYKHKGINFLMETMNEAVKKIPLIKLNIIGEGPEEENLKNLVKKYELENNVFFLEKIKNDDLYKYYKSSVATIVPSLWLESHSYVTEESIYFNTPVIGSDAGGIREQIKNTKKGALFERGNKNDLLKKLNQFL